ncbi:hypothetical protein IWT25_02436 [Secundilactobacillus pentosiphilus]|uniref:Uncharacterized protein n=1 Tax=Secundilactobacillus pentosiphilus TaxID=1714682 RepID=A0A1Z5IZX3_9LACO|nr:hypothetical protein [Secundilactobacillus pentosiphilus]GAX07088.1 hypothetical protein IWT25_02436 [Secundilactobacillus pentosiphilus]
MRKIIGIEIELPYRYRAYFVGFNPRFDVQNDMYLVPKDSVVKEIHGKSQSKDSENEYDFSVEYENGSVTGLKNCPGLIVHYLEANK